MRHCLIGQKLYPEKPTEHHGKMIYTRPGSFLGEGEGEDKGEGEGGEGRG